MLIHGPLATSFTQSPPKMVHAPPSPGRPAGGRPRPGGTQHVGKAAACRCESELPLEQGLELAFPLSCTGVKHTLLPFLLLTNCGHVICCGHGLIAWPETSRREAARMVRGPEATTFHHIGDAGHTLTSEMLEQFGTERSTQVTQGPSLSCCSCPCLYVPLFHFSLFSTPLPTYNCAHTEKHKEQK